MLDWLGGPFCIALCPVQNFLQAAQDATDSASLTPAEVEGMAVAQSHSRDAVLMF